MYMITSGRYQPPHRSHVAYFEEILRKNPTNELIICVLRRPEGVIERNLEVFGDENFARLAELAMEQQKNPLPNWHRFKLTSLAVRNNDLLRNRAHVILRSRTELSWSNSLIDLPEDRIWVFNTSHDQDFSRAKSSYYSDRGEHVQEVEFESNLALTGTQLREKIIRGDDVDVAASIPDGCHKFFNEHCRPYFKDGTHD